MVSIWHHTTKVLSKGHHTTPQHSTLRLIWKFKITQRKKIWKVINFYQILKNHNFFWKFENIINLVQTWQIIIFAITWKIINLGKILKNHHEKIINFCWNLKKSSILFKIWKKSSILVESWEKEKAFIYPWGSRLFFFFFSNFNTLNKN